MKTGWECLEKAEKCVDIIEEFTFVRSNRTDAIFSCALLGKGSPERL